jgi:hypothetical protein
MMEREKDGCGVFWLGGGEDFGIFLEQFGELGSFEFRVVAEQVPGFPDV